MIADKNLLRDFLLSIKREHHICEDCWYSCPQSKDGCCDSDAKGCTCGADKHNEKIDKFIREHIDK